MGVITTSGNGRAIVVRPIPNSSVRIPRLRCGWGIDSRSTGGGKRGDRRALSRAGTRWATCVP